MTTAKVDPVPVEIVNHPTPKRYELRGAYRSVVLTAANPYQQIAGPDPLRKYVTISGTAANAFVVCGSISQASDPNNVATPLVNPNGRYIPNGIEEWCIEGNQEIWVVTNTYPTIIGFTILREVPE